MAQRRVGIIGTGFMGEVHAAAWHASGHTPAAFHVRSADSPLGRCGDYGASVFTDLARFLDAVDVVDICAPTHLHGPLALAAAAAGKPTLCEKPLALTTAEGLEIIHAFEAAGVPLHVGHILRFSPEYRAARQTVVDGEIGQPAVLRLSRLSFAPKREGASWFTDESKSGGIFFDLMIHDLDYARWIAGDVTRVFAKSATEGHGHGIAILTHAAGAISHVEVSWSQPAPVFRTALEIAGSRGMVSFSSEDTGPLDVRTAGTGDDATTGLGDTSLAANPFELEVQNFLGVLDGTADPVLTALDALKAVQLAEATRESARTGKPVEIPTLEGAK